MPYSILLVEDNSELQTYLKKTFIEEGYSVCAAKNGLTTFKILERFIPDIAILDIELPDISGETVCLEIKKKYPHIPVIFLTAQDTSSRIVHGLDIGADDYITKPFIVDELLARIRVRLRQEDKIAKTLLQVADLEINKKTYEVVRGKKTIALTPKEFKLLEYFMVNKNQVLSREQILTIVWQYNYAVESRVVDMYVGMLRKKIDRGYKKKLIHSVRGFGYSLKE